MLALLQGEWLKIRRQKVIYLVLSGLFVLTIVHGIFQAFQQPADPIPEAWQPALQGELARLQEKQPELNPGTLMYEVNREKSYCINISLSIKFRRTTAKAHGNSSPATRCC